MRNPSLHITRNDLVEILEDMDIIGPKIEVMVDTIMQKGKGKVPRHRVASNLTKAERGKVKRNLANSSEDIELFHSTLVMLRFNFHQRNFKLIDKSSKDFLLLVDITGIANEFCTHFNFSAKREGYKKFIIYGINLMNRKYSLNRFKSFRERIFNEYMYEQELSNDVSPEKTELFYDLWQAKMAEHSGILPKIRTNKADYIHILYGKADADSFEADYEDWIASQFAGLAWTNSIPELIQFHGDNAGKRYTQYMKKLNDLIKAFKLTNKEEILKYKRDIWKQELSSL